MQMHSLSTVRSSATASGLARRLLVVVLLLLGLGIAACGRSTEAPAVSTPTPDGRIAIGEARATVRPNQPGAPVECTVEVTNRSPQQFATVNVGCELLNADGRSLGVGLGGVGGIEPGTTGQVKTVVYGVRSFARARAVLNAVTFQ